MAERFVYVALNKAPYYRAVPVTFAWNGGFAKAQKQKNITNLHAGFKAMYPNLKVLEISSKSMQENGDKLSAFNLLKYVPSLKKGVTVECVYQASKTFKLGGPYLDLLNGSSHDAKTDDRLKMSGAMTCFTFEGKQYPLNPRNIFYNYIYMNALLENKELSETILSYDGFTDIEFNPNNGINCQALAAAVFRSLSGLGLIDKVKDFDSFCELFTVKKEEKTTPMTKPEAELVPEPAIKAGDQLKHKAFGMGTVVKVEKTIVRVQFEDGSLRVLGREWLEKNREVLELK